MIGMGRVRQAVRGGPKANASKLAMAEVPELHAAAKDGAEDKLAVHPAPLPVAHISRALDDRA
jgi:hypothetical protein